MTDVSIPLNNGQIDTEQRTTDRVRFQFNVLDRNFRTNENRGRVYLVDTVTIEWEREFTDGVLVNQSRHSDSRFTEWYKRVTVMGLMILKSGKPGKLHTKLYWVPWNPPPWLSDLIHQTEQYRDEYARDYWIPSLNQAQVAVLEASRNA